MRPNKLKSCRFADLRKFAYFWTRKGEVQEWLNWPAWKASKRQKRFRGSNPLLSATSRRLRRQNLCSAVFLSAQALENNFSGLHRFLCSLRSTQSSLFKKGIAYNLRGCGAKNYLFSKVAPRVLRTSDHGAKRRNSSLSANKNKLSSRKRCMKKTTGKFRPFSFFGKGSRHRHPGCGKRGIRTPGTLQFNGFQDRRNRPLCHLSSGKSNTDFRFRQIKQIRFGARIVKNSLTLLRVSPVPLFTTSLL